MSAIIVYGCFYHMLTELNIATETIQPTKPKLSGPLQIKFAEPCSSNVEQSLKETTGYLKENGDAIMRIRIHERGKQKQISLVTPKEEAKSKYKETEHRVKDIG